MSAHELSRAEGGGQGEDRGEMRGPGVVLCNTQKHQEKKQEEKNDCRVLEVYSITTLPNSSL